MRLAFLGILATSLAPCSAFNPGATASLAFSTLEEAKDTYMATILQVVNKLQLPEIDIPNGSLQDNAFQIADSPTDDILRAATNNSIQITVNGLGAEFQCNQLHYNLGFMSADGAAQATIANMSVSVQVQIVE